MVYIICVTEECNYAPVPRFGLPSVGNRAHLLYSNSASTHTLLVLPLHYYLLAGNIKCVTALLIHPHKVTQIHKTHNVGVFPNHIGSKDL